MTVTISNEVLPADVERFQQLTALAAQAMAAMQQIIDSPQPTFSNIAGAQTAARSLHQAVVAEARLLRRLIRLAVHDFDGTA